MYEILFFLQLIGVIIGFANLIVVGLQKSSENQKILMMGSVCAFISIISYLFEINATVLPEMMLAVKFGYIGKCYVLLLSILFTLNYCNIKIPSFIIRGFFLFNTFMLLFILTCDYHSFYYTNMEVVYTGFFPHVRFERGIGYYLFMVVTLCLLLYFAYITLSQCWKRTGYERKRLFLIALAGLMPALMLVLYLSGILREFDPTPFGIVLSCMLVTVNVLNYGLLDTMQIAKETVIENTKEGLLIVDSSYNLLYKNKIAKEIFPQLTDDNKSTELVSWIFKEDERESVLNIGDKSYEIRISPLTEETSQIKGYIAWIFDMNFINQYTDEMISLKQEAERSNKAKSVFLAHMSHEIRTPMNAIMGFSSLALKNDNIVRIKEYLHDIYNAAHTLLNIINEILDISKIESGKMELSVSEYSTKQLFSEVISIIQSQINTELVTFDYQIPSDMPRTLSGDSTRFKEIIINLLNNAVKYTKKGYIKLIVTIEKIKGDVISIALQIEDTGIGIRKEDYAKVFEMFERLDIQNNLSIEGSGLGLSIVKNFVELMGGTIHFTSEYGKGTIFFVHLDQKIIDVSPMGELNAFDEKAVQTEIFKLNDCKALIVDDNQINLFVTSELLSQYGIQTNTVLNGYEALEEIQKTHYDIIFLDHMMPEMDGVETLKRMKQLKECISDTKIVALTANAVTGVRDMLIAEGFDDFLSKPLLEKPLKNLLLCYFKDKISNTVLQTDIDTGENEALISELKQIGIITDSCLEYYNDDYEMYALVLNTAVEIYPEKYKSLSQSFTEQDYNRYIMEVHGLKGSMRMIGANELSDFAEQQEMALNDGNIEYISETHERLMKDYSNCLHQLKKILKKYHILQDME